MRMDLLVEEQAEAAGETAGEEAEPVYASPANERDRAA
jgi:hypothetical protein